MPVKTEPPLISPPNALPLKASLVLAISLSACFLAGNAQLRTITQAPGRTMSVLAATSAMTRHQIRAGGTSIIITCEYRDGRLSEAMAEGQLLDRFSYGAAAEFCEGRHATL